MQFLGHETRAKATRETGGVIPVIGFLDMPGICNEIRMSPRKRQTVHDFVLTTATRISRVILMNTKSYKGRDLVRVGLSWYLGPHDPLGHNGPRTYGRYLGDSFAAAKRAIAAIDSQPAPSAQE
jgi:hypothetical protein